jgi:hypothetical protein
MVLLREPAGKLRFAAGIGRVRVKADELHAWHSRRARASVPMPALRDSENRRPVLPGQLQRHGQATTRAGEHYDRAYAGRHPFSWPHEKPRCSQAEHNSQG